MPCQECKSSDYSTSQEEGLYDVEMFCSKCKKVWFG